MPDITSRQHPIVGAFKKAARGEAEQVLLDGWHLVHEAVNTGTRISMVALAGEPPSARDSALITQLGSECDVFTVTSAVMDAMSPVRTPAGIVALANRRDWKVDDLVSPAPALVVVADDIQDPGNAGAIVRAAEALAATGVWFLGRSADPWGWKALRAAMGSTFRLPVYRGASTTDALHLLRAGGLQMVATVPHHGVDLKQIDFRGPTALLLGGEGSGLTPDVIDAADERVTIPMRQPVESLNVAVAAALMLYEAGRQREA